MQSPADRRRYPRLAVTVYYRPSGPTALHHQRAAIDVSLGGMRVYSDDQLAVGTRLDIELLLDEQTTARCWAKVAWTVSLPPGAGAAFDIGLEFIDMTDEGRTLLAALLEEA